MSQAYLLSCECGQNVSVSASQAGGSAQCTCGKVLEVPTLRRLRELEPDPQADTADANSRDHRAWGVRQGVVLAGGLIALFGGMAAGVMQYAAPQPPGINLELDLERWAEYVDQMTLLQTWEHWHGGMQRLGVADSQQLESYRRELQTHRFLQRILLGVAIAGAVLAVAGGCLGRGRKA